MKVVIDGVVYTKHPAQHSDELIEQLKKENENLKDEMIMLWDWIEWNFGGKKQKVFLEDYPHMKKRLCR